MPENLQGMVTDQDVFNMILESFQQYGTPSKMWEAAKSMHGTDIEESAPGYEDYMEQQALEWEASQNNMTVEEWISYVDYVEEELDNMYSSVSDEDLNAILLNKLLKRNIDLIKYSPEQYYLQMIEEYGITLNYIPLKDIASYLGITPQALSRIRKRIF